MDDTAKESHNPEINVEEILQKIRENVRRRKVVGDLPHDPDSSTASASDSGNTDTSGESFQRDLSIIHTLWDLHKYNYSISSHRPCIGKILVKGRQLVHGEVRRYVDPMISRQTEFNASTVRILSHTSQICTELSKRVDKYQKETDARMAASRKESRIEVNRVVQAAIADLNRDLKTKTDRKREGEKSDLLPIIEEKIDSRLSGLFSQAGVDNHSRTRLAHLLEERLQNGLSPAGTTSEPDSPAETNYFLFEERFRGSREDIKQRQLAFLPYFENSSRVLDIGCGRGEFLELLRDHNRGGIGVDLDEDMISYCRTRQFEVIQSDAITYLETLEDESLDGIFIDQVVEHLEPDYLISMLALCYRKLKSGYYIVAETVNPLSFSSFVNFYIDPTHKRPVHPLTLQFLVESAGFRDNEIQYFSAIPDEMKLQKIPVPEKISETGQISLRVYNSNIELLNTVMWGPRDYAIIGRK